MIDHGEKMLAAGELDPEFLELTEQITQRLQAGEPVDAADYVSRYPRWAGAIHKLLPTMRDLVEYGRAAERDRRRDREQTSPVNARD